MQKLQLSVTYLLHSHVKTNAVSNIKIKVKKKFSRNKKKHVPTLELVDLVDSSQKVVKNKRLNCCP